METEKFVIYRINLRDDVSLEDKVEILDIHTSFQRAENFCERHINENNLILFKGIASGRNGASYSYHIQTTKEKCHG